MVLWSSRCLLGGDCRLLLLLVSSSSFKFLYGNDEFPTVVLSASSSVGRWSYDGLAILTLGSSSSPASALIPSSVPMPVLTFGRPTRTCRPLARRAAPRSPLAPRPILNRRGIEQGNNEHANAKKESHKRVFTHRHPTSIKTRQLRCERSIREGGE